MGVEQFVLYSVHDIVAKVKFDQFQFRYIIDTFENDRRIEKSYRI